MGSNLKDELFPPKMTGVICDKRMLEHKCLWEDHPERPERLSSIFDRCTELGLLQRCKILPSRKASEAQVGNLHSPEQFSKLQSICDSSKIDVGKLEEAASRFDSVYFHPSTFEAALLAGGSAIDLTENVLDGKIKNGMAIIRPPGHHAMKSKYCGYCFFNNVGLAARHALDTGRAKRILIVDFDVHHGQGTQQMFYNDKRVLYFSTHRYENGKFWPNLKESDYNWIGSGDGAGFNCNVPLNKIGMGNTEFLTVWHHILLPIAYQFNPDLVLISAGFDSALNDPKGGMRLTPQCYPHLVSPLMGLAAGKVVVILEGGYCLKALAEGAALTLRTLLGDPCPLIQPTVEPMEELVETLLNSMTVLRDHWALGLLPGRAGDEGVHVPKLSYDWIPPPPVETYSTKNPNPVTTFENCSPFDAELSDLILTTNLHAPKNKVILGGDGKNPITEDLLEDLLSKVEITPVKSNEPCEAVQLMDAMLTGKCSAGVVVTSQQDVLEACQYGLKMHKLNRILVLDWAAESGMQKHFQDESNILFVALQGNDGLHGVNLNLPRSAKDKEILDIIITAILPIGYEYCPELILVNGPEKETVSPEIFAHSLHLIKALANGKVLLTFNGLNNCLHYKLGVPALNGDPIPRLSLPNKFGADEHGRLSKTRDDLSERWMTLKPFMKRVRDKCSIPLGDYDD